MSLGLGTLYRNAARVRVGRDCNRKASWEVGPSNLKLRKEGLFSCMLRGIAEGSRGKTRNGTVRDVFACCMRRDRFTVTLKFNGFKEHIEYMMQRVNGVRKC